MDGTPGKHLTTSTIVNERFKSSISRIVIDIGIFVALPPNKFFQRTVAKFTPFACATPAPFEPAAELNMTMKLTRFSILIILIYVSFVSSIGADTLEYCSFMEDLERILTTDPEESAMANEFTKPGHFLSVGNGYAPARPGFSGNDEVRCVMEKHGFDMVWAGADVMACEGQHELGKKVEEYATQYNRKIKASLIVEGLYECSM